MHVHFLVVSIAKKKKKRVNTRTDLKSGASASQSSGRWEVNAMGHTKQKHFYIFPFTARAERCSVPLKRTFPTERTSLAEMNHPHVQPIQRTCNEGFPPGIHTHHCHLTECREIISASRRLTAHQDITNRLQLHIYISNRKQYTKEMLYCIMTVSIARITDELSNQMAALLWDYKKNQKIHIKQQYFW